MEDDFLYRDVPTFGRRVFRLGLATNYGIEGDDLEWALAKGVNYIFWTPNLSAQMKHELETEILPRIKEQIEELTRRLEEIGKEEKLQYVDQKIETISAKL